MSDIPFRKRRPNQKTPPPSENEIKGWLAETITKWLHEFPGLRVEHDVMVTTTDGEDETQVDVLLVPRGMEHDRGRYTVIECKNEGKSISIEHIRSFADKLDDIGVPSNRGWYVSVKGFTSKAQRRAKQHGMKMLKLTGIEATKRLMPEVFKALQSIVYVLADFGSVVPYDPSPAGPLDDVHEAMIFIDGEGHWKHVLDYVYEAWRDGTIQPMLGTHVLLIDPPPHWFRIIKGQKYPACKLSVTVYITGHVHVVEGEGQRHELVDVEDGSIHRIGARAEFSQPPGEYALRAFGSEVELAEHAPAAVISLVERVKVPRMRYWGTMYWPPSPRVTALLDVRMRAFMQGLAPDPRPFDFFETEGRSIAVAWEEIDANYIERSERNAPSGQAVVRAWWSDDQNRGVRTADAGVGENSTDK